MSRKSSIPDDVRPQRLRSDLLRAEIEILNDEIIVRTDQDGSVKLRGSTNVPMFLTLWNAPKHRIRTDQFLGIDPRTSHTNLERHRARLCARLQDVLLEIVSDEQFVRMQRCR